MCRSCTASNYKRMHSCVVLVDSQTEIFCLQILEHNFSFFFLLVYKKYIYCKKNVMSSQGKT